MSERSFPQIRMKVTIMKTLFLVALVVGAGSLCIAGEPLPRGIPEAQGISSSAILEFIEAADKNIESMNSFMLVRHGQVVAEGWWSPYNADSPHSLYSLSKSFTSTAVGLAISEGKLSVDDEVLKFFPDDAPAEPSKNLKAMRVSDLLRMSTGHQVEPKRTKDEAWTKTFLAQPVPYKPGTHFLYNTSATYMLSAIVQKATGTTVLDYLKPRLFEPLGIEHPTWETSPQGISTGGYGLSIRTEDIAKFGQLYLRKEELEQETACCPRPGLKRPRHVRPPMSAPKLVIGIKATANSSGVAAIMPIAAMERSKTQCASSCRTRMP